MLYLDIRIGKGLPKFYWQRLQKASQIQETLKNNTHENLIINKSLMLKRFFLTYLFKKSPRLAKTWS